MAMAAHSCRYAECTMHNAKPRQTGISSVLKGGTIDAIQDSGRSERSPAVLPLRS
jgi:hypothetical protein